MPFDQAIKTELEKVLGPLPNNLQQNKPLSDFGVTADNLADVWWVIETRFDVNTDLADLSPDMTVGEAWAYWKLKIAEDPENNPEVP